MCSSDLRFLPEVVITLVAGAGVPIVLVLLLVDQRTQQRVRASQRARQKRRKPGDAAEAAVDDSVLIAPDAQTPAQR